MTAGTEPALSASEWLSGIDRGNHAARVNCRVYASQTSTCSLILHFGKENTAMQHSPASPVGFLLRGQPSHAVTEHMASPRHHRVAEQAASPKCSFVHRRKAVDIFHNILLHFNGVMQMWFQSDKYFYQKKKKAIVESKLFCVSGFGRSESWLSCYSYIILNNNNIPGGL